MPALERVREIREPRTVATTVLWILALSGVYYASGRLGLLAQVVVGGVRVTPLWPPTGVALASLLLLGLRIWPAIALGEFFVVASIGGVSWGTLGIVTGNTVAPVVAYLLLRRFGFRPQLDRLRDGVLLVFVGGASMLISATTATLVLYGEGALPWPDYVQAWSAWWTGDAMGVLVVAPLLLAIRSPELPGETSVWRWTEMVLLLGGTAVVTLAVTSSRLSLLFLVFPLVIWAAIRFQLPGAAPCVLLISVLAVPAAVAHTGPFHAHTIASTMLILQLLNGSAALTALLLSAVITERNVTHRMIEEACIGLAEVVARLAPDEVADRWPGARDEDEGEEYERGEGY
ncbi:MASE1 domain-containing protein [Streptacidiphilus fuscans]|uniref:MASE1 domain-containing protein n=1 Tax=Streptacidiphilus fuscans TaxID=2789292 RepID=A0A931BEP6_9ACTN|nr:MASE1 domain-containing protein [Streptacidiphilus fuscans]MBF9072075.1 MASE1 domain-containing protein [Streptacidiphilus fuscans]